MQFWTSERLRRVSIIFIFTFFLSAPLMSFLDLKNASALKLGDFPAFYSAAKILQQGTPEKLYDWKLQEKIQIQDLGLKDYGFLPYAYPPSMIAILFPIASLNPYLGKWIWVALMVFCLLAFIRVSQRRKPVLKKRTPEILAFIIAFAPISAGTLGAQNVSLSMLLYALAGALLEKGDLRNDFFAGFVLGIWLFKPQYTVLLIGLLFLSRNFYAILGFAAAALIHYALGAWVMGPGWLSHWLQKGIEFAQMDDYVNADHMISISGFVKSVISWTGLAPRNSTPAILLAGGLSGLLFLWLALQFFLAGQIRDIPQKKKNLVFLYDLAGPTVVLISAHTLFYDVGICVAALIRHVELRTDRQITGFILLVFTCSLFAALRQFLPFQPLFFAALGSFIYLLRKKSVELA